MVTSLLRGLVFGVLLAAAGAASSQADNAKIRVDDAWARRAVMIRSTDANAFTGTGAVYATLVNAGAKGDALLSVTTDAASVAEIHETFQEGGLSRMREVTRIDVAPGKKVELKPGGYHVMLINLTRDLKAGETIQVTLMFQNAGRIAVTAQIR